MIGRAAVPLVFVLLVSCTGDDGPVAARSTTTQGPVIQIQPEFGCGPLDGPFVSVRVRSSTRLRVVAELVVDDVVVASSERAEVLPDVVTNLGIDASTAGDLPQRGTVRVVDRAKVVGQVPVVLRLPPDVSCG